MIIESEPKVLTKDQQYNLIRRYQSGDKKAMDEILLANQKLVYKVASKHYCIHKKRLSAVLDVEDFVSEGNIGLMRCVQKFDTTKDVEFSTYAQIWIEQKCKRLVQEMYSSIKVPTGTLMKTIRRISLKEFGKDVIKVDPAMLDAEKVLHVSSLNSPVGEEMEDEWIDLIEDKSPNPEEEYIQKETSDMLQKAIDRYLDKREAEIVRTRANFDRLSKEFTTLQSIGETFGVTRERIRQLENKSYKKLRRKIERELFGEN